MPLPVFLIKKMRRETLVWFAILKVYRSPNSAD